MVTEVAELMFKADSSQLSTANQRLDLIAKRGVPVERSVKRVTSAFRTQKGAVQQAAFQIQDFAVQVGGGQGAMRAFAQQAPQFLSIFGPGGAIIGGIVAVAAAIGGPFITSLFDSRTATDQLKEALKELNDIIDETESGTIVLTDKFAELAMRSTTLSQSAIREALLSVRDALREADEAAKDFALDLSPSALGGRFDRVSLKMGQLRDNFIDGRIDLETFNEEVNNLFLQTGDPSKQFRDVRNELAQIAEQARVASERRDILMGVGLNVGSKTAVTEAEKLAKARMEAEKKAEMERQKASFQRLFQLDEQFLEEEEKVKAHYNQLLAQAKQSARDHEELSALSADVQTRIEEKKQEEIEKIRMQAQQQRRQEIAAVLDGFSDMFGSLTALMSSENKKAFKLGQNAAIANALIKGIQSAINAYEFGTRFGGPVAGALFAAASATATGAMIGQIKSAQPPGRALGGQVRPGQAYRVGEYGPETLIMGSNGGTVVPNGGMAANDSVNLQVYNNVKVMGGQANVTTQTRQVSDRKFVTDIVVDLMSDQASPARTGLHATSNVQPRGRR